MFITTGLHLYFQSTKAEAEAELGLCDCLQVLGIVAIILGAIALMIWGIDENFAKPNRERIRLQEKHELEEKLLEQQLIKRIYANQRLQLFDTDGLQIKPFAQEILKLIGKLLSN